MSSQTSGVSNEELANHIAETAERLKRLCIALGWANVAASLDMVIIEAEKLVSEDAEDETLQQ